MANSTRPLIQMVASLCFHWSASLMVDNRDTVLLTAVLRCQAVPLSWHQNCAASSVLGNRQVLISLLLLLQEVEESGGEIVACLQDSRNSLMDAQCRDEVHLVMARASEDIRFNQMLADACLHDREVFCSSTQQVWSSNACTYAHLPACPHPNLGILCYTCCFTCDACRSSAW